MKITALLLVLILPFGAVANEQAQQQEQPQPNAVVITAPLFNAVVTYLQEKPYSEVAGLLEALGQSTDSGNRSN